MKKNWDKIALALVIIIAAAIRLYHFHDWLFFQMDQARDANLVHKAVENGISQLPLLGPRAAGTFLRLGPAFYYFQYISAKIFGLNNPAALAYPDLFFGIISIPLFYFFLRFYFKRIPTLAATAVYAFSFTAVQNSRFAWNPNSSPFWILACLFCLAKFSRSETEKGKLFWLGAAAAGLGFASQMHFLVFVSLPIIIVIYFVWSGSWRKLNWKNILLALIVLGILYFPMALSEMKTSGDNMKQFVFALKNKSNNDHSIGDKFFQNIINHGNYYTRILTSHVSPTGKFSMIAGLALIVATLLKMFFGMRDEKDKDRKDFLKIVLVWFAVVFAVLVFFAFQIRPRFFLPVFFLPFVFFAFWIEWFLAWKKRKYLGWALAAIFFLGVLVFNTGTTFVGYKSLAGGKNPEPLLGRIGVGQQFQNVTAGQLKNMSDYLRKRSAEEGRKVELYGNATYRNSVQYFLEEKPILDYGLISKKDNDPNALYFAMSSDEYGYFAMPAKVRSRFDLVAVHSFGHRLQLLELKLKESQPEEKKEKKTKESGSNENKKPAPKRTERVDWGDL
ncbi:MAG: glycosyltransferase family 39 protein [Candidatus Moranbacteria bacterium]|nr:glycosyltransferase family 39 protein [Candidatus Moranbacteria bacterium]